MPKSWEFGEQNPHEPYVERQHLGRGQREMDEALQDEKVIFHAALALSEPEERRALLNRACGNDVELRARIEALLSADAREDLLEHPAPEREAARMTTIESSDIAGESIGRYKLLQNIGEGGFGTVYMAEQQQPVVRRVALKIIKAGMDTKQVIARFEAERQALAMMEHPNIAQVFDAGETENGRPYFVMELVRGVPIVEFCDQQKLANVHRLKVFLDVCRAVQHAHQKGIIHRDLKPSNILVTMQHGDPVPKVIDFGIAKATQQRLTEKTLFTRFEQFVGTPAYMSPEQAQMSSLDVDTRSDVYSLGVLLYELLTGTTPLDVKQTYQLGLEELCRRIREEEFELPSKRASSLQEEERTSFASNRGIDAKQFSDRLQGELDWIVMKAVDKDRRRRYESASAFAADIDRYLNQEPVVAAPPSAAYQLRKLFHRHRTAVLTASAIVALLVIGTTTTTIGMFQAIAARDELAVSVGETETARKKAEQETQRALLAERDAIQSAYNADMSAAQHAVQLDNIALARKTLERHRGYSPDDDPRNWEWRALWRQCQDTAEKQLRGGPFLYGCSPDGKWVASGRFGVVQIIDAVSGEVIRGFGKDRQVRRFSPDGRFAFVMSDDNQSIQAWGGQGFDEPEYTITTTASIESLDVSPDSKWLVAICSNGKANVFDCSNGELVKGQSVGKGYRVAVANNKLALWRNPGTIRVLDLQTLEELANRENPTPWGFSHLAISPDGKFIVGQWNFRNYATIYRESDADARKIDMLQHLRGHTHQIHGSTVSPDSRFIATYSADHTIRLWETETFTEIEKLIGHDHEVRGVAFLDHGRRLVSSGNDGIRIWKLAESENQFPVQRHTICEWWRGVSVSRDGRLLAATRYNDKGPPGVDLRSTKTLEIVQSVLEGGAVKTGVRYSPADNLLTVGAADGSLAFVDLDTDNVEERETTEVLVDSDKDIFPSDFTPDGKHVLVYVGRGGNAPPPRNPDPKCAVYSVHDRERVAIWRVPKSQDCASISPDGKLVATGESDGVRFWSLDELDNPFHVPAGDVSSVDFSPDGRYLVAGGGGWSAGWIGIIDVRTKKLIDQLVGHKRMVCGIRFSPDGTRVASAGSGTNDSLRIWDFESRRQVMLLMVNDAYFNRQVDWSSDGNTLVMMGGSATVSIWRVPSMQEIREIEGTPRRDGP